MQQLLLTWGIILILGFPLSMVLLGEIDAYLKRKSHPLTGFVSNLQRFVLPPLVIVLIIQQILGLTNLGIGLQILQTALWIGVAYTVLSLTQVVLTYEDKQYTWQIAVPNLSFQAIRGAIVLLAIGYTLTTVWQVDVGQAVQALGVGSIVIALALQDTFSNLVSGFLLLIDRPFKKGDWLKVGDLTAKVIDINWRSVRLETFEGNVAIVPNGFLGKQNILNYSLPDPTFKVVEFISFSYDDPPNKVKQVIQQTLRETPFVLTNRPIIVATKSYNDFDITYRVVYQAGDYISSFRSRNQFKTRLYYAAKRHGLTMPFPIQQQYIKDLREEQEDTDTHTEIATYLRSLSYFTSLDSQTIEELAKKSTVEYFGIGEHIFRAGELVRGLYIIQQGSVAVKITGNKGGDIIAFQLSTNDFFGESAFLSNALSRIAVEVTNDLQVLRIERNAITDLLAVNTGLAKQINELREGRRNALQKVREQQDKLANKVAANGNAAKG